MPQAGKKRCRAEHNLSNLLDSFSFAVSQVTAAGSGWTVLIHTDYFAWSFYEYFSSTCTSQSRLEPLFGDYLVDILSLLAVCGSDGQGHRVMVYWSWDCYFIFESVFHS